MATHELESVPLQITHQLENKFGKQFIQQARSNLSGTVNEKVRAVGHSCCHDSMCP